MKNTQLTLTPENIGGRSVIRNNSLNYDQIVKIDLDKIIIRKGFNVRKDYGDIEALAASILENGQTLPGHVDALKNGTFMLTDGHRRFEALKLLVKQGIDIRFCAVVNKAKTSEEQRIIQMFTTQDNKHLEPVEVSELIQRLLKFGNSQIEVAVKIGKSTSYVSQMASFAKESEAVKQAVAKGNISVTEVLKIKKHIKSPTERTKAVETAISQNPNKKLNTEKVVGKSRFEINGENLAKELNSRYPEIDYDVALSLIFEHMTRP